MLFSLVAANVHAADTTSTTPEPYTASEFPAWAKDLRRTEIIAFGSLPFVTLGVTLGFGAYTYAIGETSSFPNPLDKSSQSFTTAEQLQILEMSCLVSAGLGLTDLLINFIQRTNKEQRLKRIQSSQEKILVTPLTPEEAAELIRKNSNITEDDSAVQSTDSTDSTEDTEQ